MNTTQTQVHTLEGEVPGSQKCFDEATSQDNGSQVKRHPLGVKPSGNALTSSHDASTFMGLFGRLPDALLMTVLENFDQQLLVNLGGTCRGLYAYCSHDQLWRELAINSMTHDFDYRGSWRSSLRRLPTAQLAKVDCSTLFSDALHRPFYCSQIALDPYVANISSKHEISRLYDVSLEDFRENWVDRPFILTSPVKQWKVYKAWSEDELLAQYAETVFRAESVDWPLAKFVKYMSTTIDESPLYLFDKDFKTKMKLEGVYDVPAAFQEDLFTVLGKERPDHQWLIIGSKRSGSTFHKDPNATVSQYGHVGHMLCADTYL
jgi:hypothetical protein